jgi:hypothetical protein
LGNRLFNVVVIGPEHGTGLEIASPPDRVAQYSGEEQVLAF